MDMTPVESSQIAKLGYEAGAEYPLAIEFTPNKKQQAAGRPGSVYEYAGVTPELFAAFLGAKDDPDYLSIGKFFDKVIKSHPELYPYRKVKPAPANGELFPE
jgi:KTSC domain